MLTKSARVHNVRLLSGKTEMVVLKSDDYIYVKVVVNCKMINETFLTFLSAYEAEYKKSKQKM